MIRNLASECHCRPSSLFEWNDPEDWYERLLFDLEIINNTRQEVNSTQQ